NCRLPVDRLVVQNGHLQTSSLLLQESLIGNESVPGKIDRIGMVALLGVAMGHDIFIRHMIMTLEISDQPDQGADLRLRIFLAVHVNHFNANAIVLVYAMQCFQDCHGNRSQSWIQSVVYVAGSVDGVLGARMAATHGAPAFDPPGCRKRPGVFSRVPNHILDLLPAPKYTASQR